MMRERLELKTHTAAVMISAAWPMVLALLLLTLATMLILPAQAVLLLAAIMAVVVLVTFAVCVPMYMGTYLFLPATEYKGARLLARLGRSETEVHGVPASEIIIKQSIFEKPFHVCHIRVRGTAMYFRGVPEPEKVKAWIAANFPEQPVQPAGKKGRKKK